MLSEIKIDFFCPIESDKTPKRIEPKIAVVCTIIKKSANSPNENPKDVLAKFPEKKIVVFTPSI